jgi:hypothetical protein
MERRNCIIDFEEKQIEAVIGFKSYNDTDLNIGDIAIHTNLITLLQLIHCCQLAKYGQPEMKSRQRNAK